MARHRRISRPRADTPCRNLDPIRSFLPAVPPQPGAYATPPRTGTRYQALFVLVRLSGSLDVVAVPERKPWKEQAGMDRNVGRVDLLLEGIDGLETLYIYPQAVRT